MTAFSGDVFGSAGMAAVSQVTISVRPMVPPKLIGTPASLQMIQPAHATIVPPNRNSPA